MTIKELRVVFIGTPEFSVPSLEAIIASGAQVVGVITAPDRKSGRGMKTTPSAVKRCAEKHNIPVLQPTYLKNRDFQEKLKTLNADIQVVIAFRMLPVAVWDMPPMGTVNLHASLLPNYRGAAPINWAIINGEEKTGLTTFKLKHEIDTGDVLLQKELTISKDETAGELHDRMMMEGAGLVVDTLRQLVDSEINPKPQTYSSTDKKAPKIFKEDCEIDWNKNGVQIYNLIRGLSPYPAARTRLSDKILKVFKCHFIPENHSQYPGSITTDKSTFLGFYCQDGVIQLEEVQLEGKRRMNTEDFLRGFSF